MGCGYEMACWDCGVRQDVGYGSATTWLYAHTLEEYSQKAALAPANATLHKNACIRDFLERHQGHACEAIHDTIDELVDVFPEKVKAFRALRVVEPPPSMQPLVGR